MAAGEIDKVVDPAVELTAGGVREATLKDREISSAHPALESTNCRHCADRKQNAYYLYSFFIVRGSMNYLLPTNGP